MPDFQIRALTDETFEDFAALLERNGGMFASCWCTKFHPDCAEKDQSAEGNRQFKRRLVVEGLALYAFREMRNLTEEPLLKDLLTYVARDESRHHAYGVLDLSNNLVFASEASRLEIIP